MDCERRPLVERQERQITLLLAWQHGIRPVESAECAALVAECRQRLASAACNHARSSPDTGLDAFPG